MNRWWILLVVLAGWLGLGCVLFGSRHATGTAFSDGDPRAPARIVSTAPNLTEILFALGLGERIAGVTQDSDYPPAAVGKPGVGTFWQPSIEAIIALRPDLVVTLSFEQHRSLAGRLTRMGYRCLTLDIWTVDDLSHAIGVIAEATGSRQQAEQLLGDTKARIGAVQDATAGRDRMTVLWVVQREPLRVAGRDTFIHELIELAGGENAVGPTLHKYPPIGGEQVIASAPQVIIEPAMIGANLSDQQAWAVSYWRKYPTIPAVTNGRIHVINGDPVSRLGPRLCDGIEAVARLLHPEVFGE